MGPTTRPRPLVYATNYLIDLQSAVIVDVEATTAIRQAVDEMPCK